MRLRHLTLVMLLAGCASYEDRPLDPAQTVAALRARTLQDPELLAFLRQTLPAGAQVPPPAWGLDELVGVALFEQPDLALERSRLGVSQAAEVTAGARPNPAVSVDAEKSRDPPDGESPWVLGLSLEWPLETGGRRALRLDEARHLSEAARLQLGAAAWRARARVRDALVAHLLDQRVAEAWRAEVEAQDQRVKLLTQRFAAGAVSQPDVDAAIIERVEAQRELPMAEGRVAESLTALAAATGLPSSALQGVALAWPALDVPPPPVAPGALQEAGLRNRTDVAAALSRYDAAQSALQLEIARQYPDVTLGPGYLFDQGQHKITFVGSFDLPLMDRNEGPIAEAEARRTEARAEVLALQAQVLAQTDGALARYDAARAALDASEHAAALLRQREQASRRTQQLGGADALEVSGSLQARLAAERTRLDALRAAHEALGALEDALQRPLAGAGLPDGAEAVAESGSG